MLIFFEKKGLKVKKKSLGATEFYEKNGSKKNIVDFFVVI
jgi:predicted nucleic-acid-binding Zn-ribbon protein